MKRDIIDAELDTRQGTHLWYRPTPQSRRRSDTLLVPLVPWRHGGPTPLTGRRVIYRYLFRLSFGVFFAMLRRL
jgi:hypothetical protein